MKTILKIIIIFTEKDFIKRGYRNEKAILLTKYKEMDFTDYIYCIILLFLPLLLLCISFILPYKFLLIISGTTLYLIGLSIHKILLNTSSNKYEYLPKDYKLFIGLSTYVIVGLMIFFLASGENINQNNQYFYFVVITFAMTIIAYMVCLWLLLKAILSILYYLQLKKLFPKESTHVNDYISIKELSEYINIYDQKRYLNSAIVNLLMYFITVGYVFLGIMSLFNSQDEVLKVIIDFSKEHSLANFGNTIGLFSLVLAVYTTTYSLQNRIYDRAIEYHCER